MSNVYNIFKFQNWLKLFKNPKKGLSLVYKILSDYPRLEKLSKIKNVNIKKKLFFFYKNLVKKNKNLSHFFFNNSQIVSKIEFENIFQENNHEAIFNSLANNGFVIIKNSLHNSENENIKNLFDKIISGSEIDIIDATKIKYGNNSMKFIDVKVFKRKINEFKNLKKISDLFTKKIFGKIQSTECEFYMHKSLNQKEDHISNSDTFFHIDRYLPCLKIIHYPEDIKIENGPLGFLAGSHKLNNSEIDNFILSNNNFFLENDNPLTKKFKEFTITVKGNSTLIVFTNGFHKRNLFQEKNAIRKTVFLQYTSSFNKFSLFNFSKFNNIEIEN